MNHPFKILIVIAFVLVSCKKDSEELLAKDATFTVEIEKTLEQLLKQEDTDGDKKITVDDKGSKFFKLKSESDEEF
ncbi:trehalase calcium-binding domain-containing protein, partial [Psychroserpens sp.]|uniref:trehalase calcium-binding domain-containing protein n=1 Tax=Psychroserpens sp. TaxID=2020870 RepID=UPI003C77F9BC